MMTGSKIKEFLFDLGHFSNPADPTGVTRDNLDVLRLSSDEVKRAVRSYQEFMANDFDRLSLETHGRLGIADGEIGLATRKLFEVPRCGEPDYGVELAAATGRGSWPPGCYDEYPDNHAITVWVDKRRMPSFLEDIFEECWLYVAASYRDMGNVLIRVERIEDANIEFKWESLRGSTIGLAQVPRGPQCRQRYWCKYDPTYRPSRYLFHYWCTLIAHELGHNMGFSHTRGGILNPSIVRMDFTKTAWRGDPAEPLFKRSFGGEPVPPLNDPPDEPDPDPDPDPNPDPDPPEPGNLVLRGDIEATLDGTSIGKFILIPKPVA